MTSARGFAFKIFSDIEQKQLYANIEVVKQLNSLSLSSADSARVTDLVHGTFRWRLLLITAIEVAAKRKKDQIEDNLLSLLCLASYEILFGKTTKEILVFEWVKEAKGSLGMKYAGFVNAVLRRISEKDLAAWQNEIEKLYPGRLDLVWSCPNWIINKFREVTDNDRELIELLAANNNPPAIWKIADSKESFNLALAPTAQLASSKDFNFKNNRDGAGFRIQDAASQAAAYLLANFKVKENETDWLDACAAPGGKTATMAQVSAKENIKITAIDIHPHKEQLIQENIKTHSNVTILIGDSRLSPWKSKKFDRILIDAPCSGLGAIRRRSESRWKKREIDLKELITNAQEIFDAAIKSLKPGGFIEYVVCSPIMEETDEFVRWAISNYPHLKLIPPEEYLAVFKSPNSQDFVELSSSGLRFWPHLHNTDAMFVALFQTSSSN